MSGRQAGTQPAQRHGAEQGPTSAHERRASERRSGKREPGTRSRRDRRPPFNPGADAPLSTEGGRAPDRRKVSIRWLTGTVLAGIFGAALMAGAINATLDGQYSFQRASLLASPADSASAPTDGRSNAPRKADRMLAQSEAITAHQTIRISTTSRVGDRDVIKVKPFTRVIANLALRPGDLATQVPAFNAAALTADGGSAPAPEPAEAADDGEVSLKTVDLASLGPAGGDALSVPMPQLRAMAKAVLLAERPGSGPAPDEASLPLQLLTVGLAAGSSAPTATLAYAVQELDASSALDVRIVPENLTEIGKTPAGASPASAERTVMIEDGDTLASVLKGFGGTPEQARGIGRALGDAASLSAGQRLRVLTSPTEAGGTAREPVRVSLYTADTHIATVALSDAGEYVAIQDPDSPVTASQSEDDEDSDDDSGGQSLYQSIYETALHQSMPKPVIDSLLRVYAYDVDLTRHVRPGDTFEAFYDGDGEEAGSGEVLYTALSIGGELKRFYRFESEDGSADYYDEDGKSARKFLMRKPVNGGRMSSPFGFRTHPILGYAKLHTGTDWAEPIGTPIMATGNGTLIMAGNKSGYGRHIEIQHANGYVTTYSHMSAFARGMAPGVKVRLGQVIGYVGNSGLSTGSHVHYEVKINGNFVDSMRIKLPQGRELDGGALVAFRKERGRIDGMMNKAPTAEAASVEAAKKT